MTPDSVSIEAPGKRKHGEKIYELVAEQWRDDLRRHAREGRINNSHYDWNTSHIAVDGDKVVAHFGVYNIAMRIGTARVAAAGVNLVVTDPNYRKRGLMPNTIRASMAAMRENGYDISIVCNAIASYYTRFGYVSAWPEHDVFIRLRDMPNEPPAYKLRKFKPQHRQDLADLFNAENSTVTGTAVRPTFLRTKEPDDLLGSTWADESGATVGYLIYDIVSNGKAVWHYDSAGDPSERLRVLALIARREGCEEVRFNRLPHNSRLAQKVRTINSTTEITYRPTGGWLVRVINLRTLLGKMTSELSRRLLCSYLHGWSGTLMLANNSEEVTLDIDNSRVELLPNSAESRHSVRGGEGLARLFIGSEEPSELVVEHGMELSGDAPELVRALFPAQHPQMGNADL